MTKCLWVFSAALLLSFAVPRSVGAQGRGRGWEDKGSARDQFARNDRDHGARNWDRDKRRERDRDGDHRRFRARHGDEHSYRAHHGFHRNHRRRHDRDTFARRDGGRPHGWDRGKKKGWGNRDLPPGQAKKTPTSNSWHHPENRRDRHERD